MLVEDTGKNRLRRGRGFGTVTGYTKDKISKQKKSYSMFTLVGDT